MDIILIFTIGMAFGAAVYHFLSNRKDNPTGKSGGTSGSGRENSNVNVK